MSEASNKITVESVQEVFKSTRIHDQTMWDNLLRQTASFSGNPISALQKIIGKVLADIEVTQHEYGTSFNNKYDAFRLYQMVETRIHNKSKAFVDKSPLN